jgi:hypothetical protein
MVVMSPGNVYAARMPTPPRSMAGPLSLRTAEEVLYPGAALVVGFGSIQ